MKLITAIIKPHMLDEAREALSKTGIQGLTVTEVKGSGARRAYRDLPGRGVLGRLRPKIKIDVVADDGQVDAVLEAIKGSARTGEIGDGKVFVSDVGQAVRIRTGESGPSAL